MHCNKKKCQNIIVEILKCVYTINRDIAYMCAYTIYNRQMNVLQSFLNRFNDIWMYNEPNSATCLWNMETDVLL